MTNEQLEQDMQEILDFCEMVQADKLQGSAAVFTCEKEDRHYYDEFIKRGVMIKDPMGEGYMFADKYKIDNSHKDCNRVQKKLNLKLVLSSC